MAHLEGSLPCYQLESHHLTEAKEGKRRTNWSMSLYMKDGLLRTPRWFTYLQNIFLIRIQNKFKGLIPHRVDVIIEVSCSLPAIRGRRDEKFHIGIWSVNYGAVNTNEETKMKFFIYNLFLLIYLATFFLQWFHQILYHLTALYTL